MVRETDLEVIADFYGYDNQRNILIEEMAELTQVLMKGTRIGGFDYEHIREEIADVEIMLYQIKHILNMNTDDVVEYKVNRQISRLDAEKAGYQE